MTDEQALRAAILAAPDDDTFRLAYADWLEENGQHDRAEFIRVQVELARELVNPSKSVTPHIESLLRVGYTEDMDAIKKWRRFEAIQTRERELFDLHQFRWFDLPASWRCALDAEPDGRALATVRRGFVNALTCTAADFLRFADRLVWTPTVVCGECILGETVDHAFSGRHPRKKCPRCSGTGRVPNPDPPAATCQPVREVTFTDSPPPVEEYFTNPIGDRRYRYKIAGLWVGMPEAAVMAAGSQEALHHVLLSARWPGITFHLPAVAS